MLIRLLFVFAFLVTNICISHSQNESDLSNKITLNKYTSNFNQAAALYKEQTHNSLEYIYGREYKIKYSPSRPNPFFNSALCKGSVFVNGISYPDLYLIYDVFIDELIVKTESFNKSTKYIRLKKSTVDSFYIQPNDIKVKMVKKIFPDDTKNITPSGFYEEVYNNTLQLFFRHKVSVNTSSGYDDFDLLYDIFLKKEGTYQEVSKKRQLLKLFWEDRKIIRKKISETQTAYKKMSRVQLKNLFQFIEIHSEKGAI